jgi:hypothetical protein
MLDIDYEFSQLQADFMFLFDFVMRNSKNPMPSFSYDRVQLPLCNIYELMEINETPTRGGVEEFDPVYRPSERDEIRHRILQANSIDVRLNNKEFNALFDRSKENIKHMLERTACAYDEDEREL